MNWYRIRRNYRVEDFVYILAPTARDAVEQHWEGFGGIRYGFGDDANAWVTEADLIEDGEIRMGRARRTDLTDVPAWVVNAAVKLKVQAINPELEIAVERWNFNLPVGKTFAEENEPLRSYLGTDPNDIVDSPTTLCSSCTKPRRRDRLYNTVGQGFCCTYCISIYRRDDPSFEPVSPLALDTQT